jgi:hypothetical protein
MILCLYIPVVHAQVPGIINYQGRITVAGTNFDGIGLFKFALVDGTGTTTFWSNGVNVVSNTVTKGLYSVLLGDTSITNMAALNATVFTNNDVRLRVWFDGGMGLQQLSPDQRIGAVGYALMAGNVPDAAITSNKIAAGAVGATQIAAGAVGSSQLAAGAVGSSQLASNLTVAGVLSGNGGGLTNVSGTVVWQNVTGASQQAQPNTGYIANNASPVTITLPASPNVGDIVRVSGIGAGGWKIAQNDGQSILLCSAVAMNVGVTWTAHGASTNWHSVASSADGTRMVTTLGGGGQIYTSADSGMTWTPHGPSTNWSSVASSADGSKLVAVVFGGQIYTSTDSGATWSAHGASTNWECVASSADGSKLVAGVFGGQLYTSTDSGATWSPHAPSLTWITIASSADGTRFAAVAYGDHVYTSADTGTNWTPHGATNNWSGIASSADGTKLVAITWPGQIFISADSGTNWGACAPSMEWNAVACSADATKLVAVVQGGQVYTSSDAGTTWTPRENNRNWWAVASSADGTKLVAVVYGGQIYTSVPALAYPNGTTTPGTAGYLIGGQGAAIELQYIGNNQFLPLSYTGTIFGC